MCEVFQLAPGASREQKGRAAAGSLIDQVRAFLPPWTYLFKGPGSAAAALHQLLLMATDETRPPGDTEPSGQ
jgi:hypothetical protein